MRSFFGDCDKEKGNPHGKIVNTNPLWTKDKNIADIEDDISGIEKLESSGQFIDGKARARKMARKLGLEKTLSQIKASNPVGKIKGTELDDVRKAVESFEEEIKNLNPTRYDEEQAKKGNSTVNPTLQGYHSKTPCIKLKSESELEFAKSCNMKINEHNEVSRDDMTRGLWLGERILGIRPDHHRLKREAPHGHVHQTSQFQVGELPLGMGPKNISKDNVFNKSLNNTEDIDRKLQKLVDEKSVKMWACDLVGCCGKKMRLSQKGVHTKQYRKSEKAEQIVTV